MVFELVGQVAGQNPPQPDRQLPFAVARKLVEIALRLQKGFLHDIRSVEPRPQLGPHPRPREQPKAFAIRLQHFAQSLLIAGLGPSQQLLVRRLGCGLVLLFQAMRPGECHAARSNFSQPGLAAANNWEKCVGRLDLA